jgi:hypothetical protein
MNTAPVIADHPRSRPSKTRCRWTRNACSRARHGLAGVEAGCQRNSLALPDRPAGNPDAVSAASHPLIAQSS